MQVVDVYGFKIIKESLDFLPMNEKILINTVSPNSYGLSIKDKIMKEALLGSDYLILDGLYFGLAAILLKGKKIKRITGWNSFEYFSKKMNETRGKIFFLGSSNETLDKIAKRYKVDFPYIETAYYSPPYKKEFSDEDNNKMYEAINAFKPNVLFIGMTAPKQEKWGFQNKQFVDVNIISTIGNVFDWYAGNSIRPGKIWIKLGLEWLVRIYYRPEIFKRNIANQMLFFWHLFLAIVQIRKFNKNYI